MYLSIYLSIHPFIYLSILSLSICRSFLILTYLVLSYFILSYLTHFFILSHLSLYLSIYLSIDLIYLFILSNLPSNLSVYSFNLSVYLRVSICKLENEAILQHFVPMCFAIFPVYLSKVLRLPRKTDTRSYEVLHLSRKII